MIAFPNAKINIGLNITEKRADGFHNIETIFYPVPWNDVIEVLPSKDTTIFTSTGTAIPGNTDQNLCLRAYTLLSADFKLPPVHIHLHKIIPIGAGLGGGSSDAAFAIKILDTVFKLGLSNNSMESYARMLGSDCAFFINNSPVFAFGKGDEFKLLALDLSNYKIVLVKPPIHINTAIAYSGVKPKQPQRTLTELIKLSVEEWKLHIHNDFEDSVFPKHPEIAEIKKGLYDAGAIYASMSGSGSCLYGIFKDKPVLNFENCTVKIIGADH